MAKPTKGRWHFGETQLPESSAHAAWVSFLRLPVPYFRGDRDGAWREKQKQGTSSVVARKVLSHSGSGVWFLVLSNSPVGGAGDPIPNF